MGIIVPTRDFWRVAIRQQTAPGAAGAWTHGIVKLVVAPFTPGPDTAFGSLAIATFDGYADVDLPSSSGSNWNSYNGQDGFAYQEAVGSIRWDFSAPVVTGNTVYGFAIAAASGGLTMGSGLFDTPQSMNVETDALFLKFAFSMRSLLDGGDCDLIS